MYRAAAAAAAARSAYIALAPILPPSGIVAVVGQGARSLRSAEIPDTGVAALAPATLKIERGRGL